MSLLKRVVSLIPKKASREERTFYSELLKAVDSGGVSQSDIDSATESIYSTLDELGNPIDSKGNISVEFPQTPTGFTANAAFTSVILEWNAPVYSGHAFTEVFRADVDDLAVAEANGVWLRSYANIIADAVDSGTTHYYWVRFVNKLGQEGAFNSPTGTEGTTSVPVEQMIAELEGRITSTELAQELATPIAKIPTLESDINAVELDVITKYNEQQALIGEARSLAENGSDQLVNDVLALSNDFSVKYQSMRDTLNDIESYVNAVITTDPETGQITLDALAAYEDQFNLSIAGVQQDIDALEGSFTLKVWQTDVDAMGNQTLSAVNDEFLARSGVCSLTDFTDAASCIANGGSWALSSLAEEKKTLVALSNTAETNAKAYTDTQTQVVANDLAAEVLRTDTLQSEFNTAKSQITTVEQAVSTIEGENYTLQINDATSRITDVESELDTLATVQQSTYTKAETDEQVSGILDYVGAGDFEKSDEDLLTAESIIQNALDNADEKENRRYNNAFIIRNEEASKTADEALASSIELLQASFEDNAAAILNEQEVRATEIEAEASARQTLQAMLEDDIASVEVQASTAITKADDAQADANTALVKYGVKLDVNGYVTGFAQNNNGTTGSFYIRADEFAVIDPASTTDSTLLTEQEKEDATPFVVTGGNTYIKNAYIKDLVNDNFVGGKIVADEVITNSLVSYSGSFGTITGGSVNIGNGRLTIDAFGNLVSNGGVVRSANYVAGVSGFQLSSNAAGTSLSPNIEGAYIKGSIVDGGSVISGNFVEPTEKGHPYYSSAWPLNSSVNITTSITTPNDTWVDSAFSEPFGFYAYDDGLEDMSVVNRFLNRLVDIEVNASISGDATFSRIAAARIRVYTSSGTELTTKQGVFFYEEGVRTQSGGKLIFTRTEYSDGKYRIDIKGVLADVPFYKSVSNGGFLKLKIGVYDAEGGATIASEFKVKSRKDTW